MERKPTEKIEFISGPGQTRRIVPPLEAYVEGPPPEVEAKPLREEPIPHTIRASELAPIIERLRADTVEMTQVRVDFNEEVAWAVPEPRFTIFFRKPEKRVIGKMVGARTDEELKEYQGQLEVIHRVAWPAKIERHYRRDLDTHFFWLFPEERRHIRRADPYLIAREVVNLNPKRLTLQTISKMIRPPPGVIPGELPWRLRELPEPRYPV